MAESVTLIACAIKWLTIYLVTAVSEGVLTCESILTLYVSRHIVKVKARFKSGISYLRIRIYIKAYATFI